MKNIQSFLMVLFPFLLMLFIQFEIYNSLYSLILTQSQSLQKLEKTSSFEKPVPRLEDYKGPSCKSCTQKVCDCIQYVPNPPIGKLRLKEGQNPDLIDSHILLMKNIVVNYVYYPNPLVIDGSFWPGLKRIPLSFF